MKSVILLFIHKKSTAMMSVDTKNASASADARLKAELVGFEPTRALRLLTDFESVPFSRTWVQLQA